MYVVGLGNTRMSTSYAQNPRTLVTLMKRRGSRSQKNKAPEKTHQKEKKKKKKQLYLLTHFQNEITIIYLFTNWKCTNVHIYKYIYIGF